MSLKSLKICILEEGNVAIKNGCVIGVEGMDMVRKKIKLLIDSFVF